MTVWRCFLEYTNLRSEMFTAKRKQFVSKVYSEFVSEIVLRSSFLLKKKVKLNDEAVVAKLYYQ